jgi:hypothetical protein
MPYVLEFELDPNRMVRTVFLVSHHGAMPLGEVNERDPMDPAFQLDVDWDALHAVYPQFWQD